METSMGKSMLFFIADDDEEDDEGAAIDSTGEEKESRKGLRVRVYWLEEEWEDLEQSYKENRHLVCYVW